jgi:hypothetical protein
VAIAFDAATDGGNNGGSSNSLMFSHTVTGSNPILFVGFVGDAPTGSDDITGVSYGGVSCSLIAKRTDLSVNRFIYLYVLAGPSTGANNVVITCTNNHFLLAGSVSYTGAAQFGQPDSSNSNQAGDEQHVTVAVSTVADNCWTVLIGGGFESNDLLVAGAGSTRRTAEASFGTWALFDSNGPITPPAVTTMECHYTAAMTSFNGTVTGIIASFAPFVAASTDTLLYPTSQPTSHHIRGIISV